MGKIEFTNGERYHIFNRGTDKRKIFMDRCDYQRFFLGMREFNTVKPIGSLRDKLQLNESKADRLDFKSDRVSSPVTSNPCKQEFFSTGFEALSPEVAKHRASNPVNTGLETRLEITKRRASNPVNTGLETLHGQLVKVIAYCLNPNHYHLILEQIEDGGISKFIKKVSSSHTTYFNKKYHRSGALFQGKFKAAHIDSNEYLLYLSAYVNKNNFIHGGDGDYQYSSWDDYTKDSVNCRASNPVNTGLETLRDCTCDKSIVLDQFGGDKEKYKKFAEVNAEHLKNKKMLAKYLLE